MKCDKVIAYCAGCMCLVLQHNNCISHEVLVLSVKWRDSYWDGPDINSIVHLGGACRQVIAMDDILLILRIGPFNVLKPRFTILIIATWSSVSSGLQEWLVFIFICLWVIIQCCTLFGNK